jgi:hypothetical protein
LLYVFKDTAARPHMLLLLPHMALLHIMADDAFAVAVAKALTRLNCSTADSTQPLIYTGCCCASAIAAAAAAAAATATAAVLLLLQARELT